MAVQQFNDNILILAGKPLDDKFGPYSSPAAANAAIPQPRRHAGLIFGVYTTPLDIPNSDIEYYCYFGDFADNEYRKLIKPTLQEVTSSGNSTTAKIVHADATANNESATLGQVITLISNATGGVSGDFVPYSGATKNVILGDFSITADSFRFDLTPLTTQAKGRLLWNESKGSLTLGLNTNVENTIGLDDHILVRNQTGTTIQKGRVVSIVGTSSVNEKLLIGLSDGTGVIDSNYILGIAAENISTASNGYVITRGRVTGINTTGSLYGETWVDGDLLYLNSSILGGLTKNIPLAPRIKTPIAVVLKSDSTNGILELKINLSSELNDLNNVSIGSLSNRNLLVYNSTLGVWDNRTLGYVINGTSSQFVKGNGSLDSTVYQPLITGGATTITSSNLTTNRVLISDGSGKVAVSSVTSTELLSLTGVTGNIQEQLDQALINPVFSQIILKEGFEFVSGSTLTLSQEADEIHSINVNGQYIPEDYYSLSGDTITFTDIIFETEPEPDQIWIFYFKEMT
jgi:dUTPase